MRNRENGTRVGIWLVLARKNLFASFGSGLKQRMSLEGCERVNFMRGEVARAASTYGPNFEGEAKVKRRGCLVHLFESDQSQPGKPQRPESVTI